MALMFTMGGCQGLVGWWMVKSGLEHEHVFGIERSEHDIPRVSPYRLTAHVRTTHIACMLGGAPEGAGGQCVPYISTMTGCWRLYMA